MTETLTSDGDHTRYRLLGGLGSPYSMKMRAVLRYRRLPHIWIQMTSDHEAERAAVKPAVIPILQFPDGSYQNDSTPLIETLERIHADRSILPTTAADAFLAFLLEDMADEWGTKLMFHYRWFADRDQLQLSRWLAFDRLQGLNRILTFAEAFRSRQVSRMALVGCTPANAPVIEESALRLLRIFEAQVVERGYFFGTRPSLAEFSWYGQFSQLIVDPTPNDLLRTTAPFTVRWVMQMDDASGVDGEWTPDDRAPAVEQLLSFAGEVYFPYLLANTKAVSAGQETFAVDLLGRPWIQGAFKYQSKCLATLRARFASLPAGAAEALRPILERTGCLNALQTSSA